MKSCINSLSSYNPPTRIWSGVLPVRRGVLDFLSFSFFFYCVISWRISPGARLNPDKLRFFFFSKFRTLISLQSERVWKCTWKSDVSSADAFPSLFKKKKKGLQRITFASHLMVNRKQRPRLESLSRIYVSGKISLRWRIWHCVASFLNTLQQEKPRHSHTAQPFRLFHIWLLYFQDVASLCLKNEIYM